MPVLMISTNVTAGNSAERITAISSSKGELYSSSVVGVGLAARRRSKISWRLLRFMRSGEWLRDSPAVVS